jgi:DNA-binding response OmpR family regulator
MKHEGVAADVATKGEDALWMAGATEYDAIVLDLMLPGRNGFEVRRELRADGVWSPVLMLTARDAVRDRVPGLDAGADDYLTKPFNPRELVARVKSILRRATPERREAKTTQIRHGDLLVDAGRREVQVTGQDVQLAPKEFDLLWELLDHNGLVLTRDQLLERVWGYTFAGDTRTVDVHIRQLRRKLGDASPIVTVWGVGYKAAPAKDASKDTVSA